jgi:hypothetical protein
MAGAKMGVFTMRDLTGVIAVCNHPAIADQHGGCQRRLHAAPTKSPSKSGHFDDPRVLIQNTRKLYQDFPSLAGLHFYDMGLFDRMSLRFISS